MEMQVALQCSMLQELIWGSLYWVSLLHPIGSVMLCFVSVRGRKPPTKILGSKRSEVTAVWRKLHDGELSTL
jgi:hypothetical protein